MEAKSQDKLKQEGSGKSRKLKKLIFECFLEVMKDRGKSALLISMLVIINYTEMICLMFDKTLGMASDSSRPALLQSAMDLLRIYPYLAQNKSQTTYLLISFTFSFFILLYIALFILLLYRIRTKKPPFLFPLILLRIQTYLLYWIFILPLTDILIHVLFCDTQTNTHDIISSLQCWGSLHFFYVVFFSFVLFAAVCLAFAAAFFFNESNHAREDPLARIDNNFEIYWTFYRIYAVVFIHTAFIQARIVAAFIHSCASLFMLICYLKQLPYYVPLIAVVDGLGRAAYCWIALNFLAWESFILFRDEDYQGQNLSIFIPLPFIFLTLYKYRLKKRFHLLYEFKGEMVDLYSLNAFVDFVVQLIRKRQLPLKEEILLMGFISKHREECTKSACPTKDFTKDLYLPATRQTLKAGKQRKHNNKIFLVHLFKTIIVYQVNGPRLNRKAGAHLIYSDFLFRVVGNIHLAFIELQTSSDCVLSLQQEFSIFRKKKQIEAFLLKRYKRKEINQQTFENMDVTEVILFEKIFKKLRDSVGGAVGKHIEFWNHLNSIVPNLNVIDHIGKELLKNSKEVESNFKHLMQINPNFPKALELYGWYKKDICTDEEEGNEFLSKANQTKLFQSLKKRMNDFELMFADDTAIIVVNGSSSNSGVISWTNYGIYKVFGYNGADVIGKNVSILMPSEFRKHHPQFMENYYQTGIERVMNKSTPLLAMHRSGYLFAISLIVKGVPSLKKDIQYIGLIRNINNDSDYIMTDTTGRIRGLSTGLTTVLNATSKFFTENRIYIQLICPELFDIQEVTQGKRKRLCTRLDLLEGNANLQFYFLPELSKNSNLLQLLDFEDYGGSSNFFPKSLANKKQVTSLDIFEKITRYSQNYFKNGIKGKSLLKSQKVLDYETAPSTQIQTEIITSAYGDGLMTIKIFKMHLSKGNHTGSSSSSSHFLNHFVKEVNTPHHLPKLEQISLNLMKSDSDSDKKDSAAAELKDKVEMKLSKFHHISPNSSNGRNSKSSSSDLYIKQSLLSPDRNFKGKVSQISKHDNKAAFTKLNKRLKLSSQNLTSSIQQLKHQKSQESPNTKAPRLRSSTQLKSREYSDDSEEERELEKKTKSKKAGKGDKEKENKSMNSKIEKMLDHESNNEVDLDKDETSSMISNSKNVLKEIKVVKKAMLEEYKGKTIKQLQAAGFLIFIVLFIVTISNYAFTSQLSGTMTSQFDNLQNNKQRLQMIERIGGNVRSLVLLNTQRELDLLPLVYLDPLRRDYNYAGVYSDQSDQVYEYEEYVRNNIEQFAKNLKDAENDISGESFRDQNKEYIDFGQITTYYNNINGLPDTFEVAIFTAIQTLTVHSHQVKNKPLEECFSNETSISFILENSFNGILDKIQRSNEFIINEANEEQSQKENIFLIFLIIATISLVVSIFVIIPVVRRVQLNKEKLLGLFMEIKLGQIQEVAEKCQRFSAFNFEEGGKEEDKKSEGSLGNTIEGIEEKDKLILLPKHKKHTKRKRKFKRFSTRLISLFIKFSIFFSILEAYFLFCFYYEKHFFEKTKHKLMEVSYLNNVLFLNELLYYTEQELFSTAGASTILFTEAEPFLSDLLLDLRSKKEQLFLEHFTNQNPSSLNSYDVFLSSVFFSNLCEKEFVIEQYEAECELLFGGVLFKGLDDAIVKYWDAIEKGLLAYQGVMQLYAQEELDFEQIQEELSLLLNHHDFIDAEILLFKYFSRAFDELNYEMGEYITQSVNVQNTNLLIGFILYAIMLLFMYLVLWRIFIETLKKSLNLTKSMLGIVPPEIILNTETILKFILKDTTSRLAI